MAHIQFMDELIKEYLLFRGFANTLKAFDADLKNDKEKSFRADKIIEQLMHNISAYDLSALRELWAHLEFHMFRKLESHFTPGVKKLENAVLKMYLVNAVVNSKQEKVVEFFTKLTPELHNQNEWKDWFMIPYTKNPDENPAFSLYFTKQWQDTLLISLHNFLASIFQYMPTPALLQYEDDSHKILRLQQKNDSLKVRLSLLLDKCPETVVTPVNVEPPSHLFDDFYIIAQESTITGMQQAKKFKNLIKNMGSGSSPILGRKDNSAGGVKKKITPVNVKGKT